MHWLYWGDNHVEDLFQSMRLLTYRPLVYLWEVEMSSCRRDFAMSNYGLKVHRKISDLKEG